MKVREEGLYFVVAAEFMMVINVVGGEVVSGIRLNDLFMGVEPKLLGVDSLEIQAIRQNVNDIDGSSSPMSDVLFFHIASIDDILGKGSLAQVNFYKKICDPGNDEFDKAKLQVIRMQNASQNDSSIIIWLCKMFKITIPQSKYLLSHVRKTIAYR